MRLPGSIETEDMPRTRHRTLRRRLKTGAMATATTAMARVGHLRLVRVVTASVRLFRKSSGTARSAEIAYWAILSTIPFGALMLTVVAYAAGMVLDVEWNPETIAEMAGNLANAILPAAGADLEKAVSLLLRERGALGAFGFVTLILTSSLVFGAVNRGLTEIFVVRARGRITTVVLFSVGLVAITLVLVIGLPGLAALGALLGARGVVEDSLVSPAWLHVVGAASMGLTFAFFAVFVVRVRVRKRHIALGTAVFVALFEIARWGIATYLESVSNFNIVYGSLAGVMAAIVWTYYVAFSLLITMCLVRSLHGGLYRGPVGDLVPME